MCEGKTENQERNIMILFLSNLHYKQNYQENIDKSITAVKFADYKICQKENEEQIVSCVETNEAPLLDVLAILKGKPLHAIFYFVTKKVRERKSLMVYPSRVDVAAVPTLYESEEDFFWRGRVNTITTVQMQDVELIPVRFDGDGEEPIADAITAVRAMETAIKTYLKKEAVSLHHCNLYADITGGIRTANMAMSAVMQLLQYEGVNVRRVVYSDFDFGRKGKNGMPPIHPVSNVQPINDLYKLVAGVDAFTKYGSSAALDEYFEDVKKDCAPLRTLLDAMNAFSESVLLCQPYDIVDNLKNLVPKLENFKDNLGNEQNTPTKAALFERMIDELKDIYMPMYPEEKAEGAEREVDRLEIIQWCIDNSLLQQAVTFCTEWLPEYLVDWGAIYSDDKAVQQYCAKELVNYRTWKKNLLMQFCTQKVYKPDKEGKSPLDKITDIAVGKEAPRTIRVLIVQEALRQNMGFNFDEGDVPSSDRWDATLAEILSRLKRFLESLKEKLGRLKNPQGANRESIMAETQLERKILKRIYKKPWNVVVHEKPLTELTASVFQDMYKWNLRAFETFFAITNCEYRYIGNYDYNKKAEDDYRIQEYCLHRRMKDKAMNAAAISHAMFDCGIFKTDLHRNEEALHFILHYSYIRTELRNKMNHSSEDGEKKKEKHNGELQNDMEVMNEDKVIKKKKTQEDYIPMKIQSIKKYLDEYLGEVKHLRDVLQSRHYLSSQEETQT